MSSENLKILLQTSIKHYIKCYTLTTNHNGEFKLCDRLSEWVRSPLCVRVNFAWGFMIYKNQWNWLFHAPNLMWASSLSTYFQVGGQGARFDYF